MHIAQPDLRSLERRQLDDAIADAPKPAPPELPSDARPGPVPTYDELAGPKAISGIVENGTIRLLDPTVTLPERSRVIVVVPR